MPGIPRHFLCWGQIAVMLLAAVVTAGAAQPQGATVIALSGGRFGDVAFPHRRHQDTITECAVCHRLFPQNPGSIDRLKQDGNLGPRDVMNRLCLNCHRAAKRRGEASGPTSCTACHKR